MDDFITNIYRTICFYQCQVDENVNIFVELQSLRGKAPKYSLDF